MTNEQRNGVVKSSYSRLIRVIREFYYLGLCMYVGSTLDQDFGSRPIRADEETLMQRGKAFL